MRFTGRILAFQGKPVGEGEPGGRGLVVPRERCGRPIAKGSPITVCICSASPGMALPGPQRTTFSSGTAPPGRRSSRVTSSARREGWRHPPPSPPGVATAVCASPSICSSGLPKPDVAEPHPGVLRAAARSRPPRSSARPSRPTGETLVKRQELPLGDGEVGDRAAWQKSEGRRRLPGQLAERPPAGPPGRRAPGSAQRRRGRLRPVGVRRSRSGSSRDEDHLATGGDDDDVDLRRRALGGGDPPDQAGGRGPPARAASVSAPGPGSGRRRRVPQDRRSPAGAGFAPRPTGWRCRGGPGGSAGARRRRRAAPRPAPRGRRPRRRGRPRPATVRSLWRRVSGFRWCGPRPRRCCRPRSRDRPTRRPFLFVSWIIRCLPAVGFACGGDATPAALTGSTDLHRILCPVPT